MNYLLCRRWETGTMKNYALWILNNHFREYYSFHFGHPDSFKLIIKSSDSREKILNVANFKTGGVVVECGNKNEITTEPSLSGIDSATNAINLQNKITGWQKLKEIDFVLLQLQQKPEHLILDLRDNQGGDGLTGCISAFPLWSAVSVFVKPSSM